MKREEYWLLDVAILTAIRMRLLHPDNPQLEDAVNRRHHRLTLLELAHNLHVLFQRGDIVAFRASKRGPLQGSGTPITCSKRFLMSEKSAYAQ